MGRVKERRHLDRLLDDVRGGTSAVLVIRGEPGIGKTALAHYCLRQASGCRIVQITGVESELELPFAALHQLCAPMLDDLTVIPEPQSNALRVAFGLSAGATPDRFIVGLAVLNLLAEAASDRPLVCVVDDAQWLDAPSAQVLGFVARRLQAESILLLFAVREAGDGHRFAGLPELTVEGLTDEDARALVTAAVPGHLDERVRDRIIAETRGNPLGLLELPRSMTAGELAGGYAVPSPVPLPGQLLEGYLRRVRELPRPTRQLMLLAAADPTGDATLLWRAAHDLNIGMDAAAPAEDERLLGIDSRVRFRHPLVRSAAYAAGSNEDRAAAHLALARVIDPGQDPERRVWHLATAATEPDEAIASELERAAGAAQTRAGLAAGAAFLTRSFELTVEAGRRADRGLAAAAAHLHAGAFDQARSLVAHCAAEDLDEVHEARVEQLTGQIEAAERPGREAPLRLLQTARRLERLDVALARETYLQAWWPAILAGRFVAPGGTLVDVCRAACAAPRLPEARTCDLLLDSLATAVVKGRASTIPGLQALVDLFMTNRASEDDWMRWARLATSAAYLLWDFTSWAELGARQIARARASGALVSLALALSAQANVSTLRGDLDAASAFVAEQYAVKEATGIRLASYGRLLLAAYQGDPAALGAAAGKAVEPEDGYAVEVSALATAVLNNGLRRHSDAVDAGVTFLRPNVSFLQQQALPELVEAAARTEELDVAHRAFERLSELVVRESDWATGLEARSRALLEQGESAESCYRQAIKHLGRTPLRMDLARGHLLYGEWLRGEHRRSEAREQLRRAHLMFRDAGAAAYEERARLELQATGETVRRRDVAAQHDLTPQEEHIARLARDGRSNPEIGAELFISPRTVEWHLRKIFSKLGITSRGELGDVLDRYVRR
jgi:DNA-binding CsgD family transcriptional regulator